MKKIAVSAVLAIAVAALVATTALAAPPGSAQVRGYGPGFGQTMMSPEDVTKFKATRAKFMVDTIELRKAMAVKQIELRTLYAQPTPDKAKVLTLSNELVDLRATLAKKRNAVMGDFPRGFGRGFGGKGRGSHRGPGGGFGGPGMRGPGGGGCPGAFGR